MLSKPPWLTAARHEPPQKDAAGRCSKVLFDLLVTCQQSKAVDTQNETNRTSRPLLSHLGFNTQHVKFIPQQGTSWATISFLTWDVNSNELRQEVNVDVKHSKQITAYSIMLQLGWLANEFADRTTNKQTRYLLTDWLTSCACLHRWALRWAAGVCFTTGSYVFTSCSVSLMVYIMLHCCFALLPSPEQGSRKDVNKRQSEVARLLWAVLQTSCGRC